MVKRGLGRGLSSLIPGMANEETETEFMELDITKVRPNPNQPRKSFESESLKELVESIKEVGIIQPIIVRKNDDIFEIIAGERRWRAAKEAGLRKIKAVIKDADDRDALQVALIENIQREDLDAIEEAKAYHQLIMQFQMTQAEIAQRVGKNRSTITNVLRLLALPEDIKNYISSGHISSGHAKAVLSLPDEKLQLALVKQIMDNKLSVRDVERLVKVNSEGNNENNEQVNNAVSKNKDTVDKEASEQLCKILNASVRVYSKSNNGQVKVVFSSMEDLVALIKKLKNNGLAV